MHNAVAVGVAHVVVECNPIVESKTTKCGFLCQKLFYKCLTKDFVCNYSATLSPPPPPAPGGPPGQLDDGGESARLNLRHGGRARQADQGD